MEAAEKKALTASVQAKDKTMLHQQWLLFVIKDTSVAYEAYQAFLDDDFLAVLPMGAQGVIYFDDWYIDVDQEIKDAMDQIIQDLSMAQSQSIW